MLVHFQSLMMKQVTMLYLSPMTMNGEMNSFSKIKFPGTLLMEAMLLLPPYLLALSRRYSTAEVVPNLGASRGGVLAGLAACGVMMSIVSTAADLMQNFKTGYLTLASPRSMFISQVIGTAMGCVIAPCVFWLFYKAFNDIGISTSDYPAPNAAIFRSMAILGVDGFSSLPKNCLTLCYIFFAAAIAVNLIRDLVPKKVSRFIPIPMAMAIPFYLGSYFAIDMFIGTVILFVWQRLDRAKAETFAPAVASGLICGDGLWVLPQSVLALANVKPPICMKFLSRGTNDKVDAFISTLS